jgi:hypothetical protein
MPEVPTLLLCRDILAQMKTHVLIKENPNQMSPLVETEINSNVWANEGKIGRTWGAYPHQRQYPLHQEKRESLSKIIKRLKQQKLPVPCNRPCNTPNIRVFKKPSRD